jgi:hypothetical protein
MRSIFGVTVPVLEKSPANVEVRLPDPASIVASTTVALYGLGGAKLKKAGVSRGWQFLPVTRNT